jgi:hypothetical protein
MKCQRGPVRHWGVDRPDAKHGSISPKRLDRVRANGPGRGA